MSSIEKFIKKVCVQTAVYWGNPKPDGMGGTEYDDPVEVKVRWDDVTEVIKDGQGKDINSRAKILTPVDFQEQGYLFLGRLEDIPEEAWLTYRGATIHPNQIPGAFEIISFEKIPMIMSTTVFVRIAYLGKRNI